MPLRHLLLALAVVAVWGSNFVVIKLGLAQLPPLLFATLRFVFAVLPAVLFLRRPAVPWRELAAYGVLIGAGQFGLLYLAMHGHISPGLASLVVQTQVFFTIGLSMRISHERLQSFQWAALVLAVAGIAVIAAHTDADTSVLGLVLVLLAALSWAAGNLVARRAVGVNMLAYVVWASLFSVPPLLLLSLVFEGPASMLHGLQQASMATWAAVLWQSVGNTLFGYAAWAWLLARHPAATVSPMALLVPVFGMAASAFWLGESLPGWKLGAAALVLAGLATNVFWPRWRSLWRTTPAVTKDLP
ncbi:EamA family transporter [Ideonella sp. BN130291]|uniref:EamA family transporter n=1 Tax=Ideonella sp. BN130291 TaxID=3112940 RepID=UPI002E26B31E|nr:EamA family transporter [Ideonella sp. BN130291]